jgi:hypothetical protein
MDLQSESTHFNVMNACDYQHDWSSDSDSSRQPSPRSSSASKHSVDNRDTGCDIVGSPKLGNLLKDDCYTAFSQTNTCTSNTICTAVQVTDDHLPTHEITDIESGSRAEKISEDVKLQLPMENQFSCDEALAARVEQNGSEPERAQTPVLQIHDTSASESLHSPRPQRYLRPNVTNSEQDNPG